MDNLGDINHLDGIYSCKHFNKDKNKKSFNDKYSTKVHWL